MDMLITSATVNTEHIKEIKVRLDIIHTTTTVRQLTGEVVEIERRPLVEFALITGGHSLRAVEPHTVGQLGQQNVHGQPVGSH